MLGGASIVLSPRFREHLPEGRLETRAAEGIKERVDDAGAVGQGFAREVYDRRRTPEDERVPVSVHGADFPDEKDLERSATDDEDENDYDNLSGQ